VTTSRSKTTADRCPPQQQQTARERLEQALQQGPATARELSQQVGVSEREIPSHLEHLKKSLRSRKQRLTLTPAACLDCHFTFSKRERLSRPGKCPVCRSTHLSEPLFSL